MSRLPAFTLLAACSSAAPRTATAPAPAPTTAPTPVAAAPAPTPPDLRLPTTVRPTHNTVELTLDPASEDFSGTITTALEIAAPTDVIWLNGDEITIKTATVAGQAATVSYPKKDFIALTFARSRACASR